MATTVEKKNMELNQRRSDEAFRQIVALIFEGRLTPGDRLPAERELSETLNVSRTTLRDALNRLEARGYIERRSKSGNYVCTAIPQSVRDPIEDRVKTNLAGFHEVVEMRQVLEMWAVEKAAQAEKADKVRELGECVQIMKRNKEFKTEAQFEKFSQADQRFHQILAEMNSNSIYIHLFHFFIHLILGSIYVSRNMFPGHFGEKNYEVHKSIYQAVKTGDAEQAREAMREHFDFILEHVSKKKGRKST